MLARIIIAATQIVKIDNDVDIMSAAEKVVIILYGVELIINAE